MTAEHTLDARLGTLPAKVRVPFQELRRAGQVSEEMLSDVLDAGELTREPHKLLGFAIAYLHMAAEAVPIRDTIRMAKAQNRRVSLHWSPTRLRNEHDRLARAETLARMSRENTGYDLSRYEPHLPAKFPGYLIRTSRRLGMEGLRQRHCVAGYHAQIRAGACAIATVFVDRQRWTVEIIASRRAAGLLRIGQIRSRRNARPSPEVRMAIIAALGINEEVTPSPDAPAHEHVYLDNLRRILPILRAHAIKSVTVRFDGSGDSGSIEDISYCAPPGFDGTQVQVEIESIRSHFDGGARVVSRGPRQADLSSAIEELTNDYLEETGVDWYNNDGGFGDLLIDGEAGTVSLEVSVRFTESSQQFASVRDILSGEPVD